MSLKCNTPKLGISDHWSWSEQWSTHTHKYRPKYFAYPGLNGKYKICDAKGQQLCCRVSSDQFGSMGRTPAKATSGAVPAHLVCFSYYTFCIFSAAHTMKAWNQGWFGHRPQKKPIQTKFWHEHSPNESPSGWPHMRVLKRFKMSSELWSLSCAQNTRPSSLLTRSYRVKIWQKFCWLL